MYTAHPPVLWENNANLLVLDELQDVRDAATAYLTAGATVELISVWNAATNAAIAPPVGVALPFALTVIPGSKGTWVMTLARTWPFARGIRYGFTLRVTRGLDTGELVVVMPCRRRRVAVG